MNNIQLLNIIKLDVKLHHIVKGVYPSNQIPNRVFTYPSAYIINTQPSHMKGEHWVCAWFDSNIHVDYFDSLGKELSAFDNRISMFLQTNSTVIQYNRKILQGYNSDVCGYYVLLFLIFKSRGYSMNDVISIFGKDKQMNDCFVVDFVNSNVYI